MDFWTIILIVITLSLVLISFLKDKKKTQKTLKKVTGRFFLTANQIIAIMGLIGLFLAVVPRGLIESVLGGDNIFLSVFSGALLGAVTIIPAFIAFPLASSLAESGAYLISIAAFITTLTMVGFATIPIEKQHFGMRFTFIRNLLSFIFALIIALGMVLIL